MQTGRHSGARQYMRRSWRVERSKERSARECTCIRRTIKRLLTRTRRGLPLLWIDLTLDCKTRLEPRRSHVAVRQSSDAITASACKPSAALVLLGLALRDLATPPFFPIVPLLSSWRPPLSVPLVLLVLSPKSRPHPHPLIITYPRLPMTPISRLHPLPRFLHLLFANNPLLSLYLRPRPLQLQRSQTRKRTHVNATNSPRSALTTSRRN